MNNWINDPVADPEKFINEMMDRGNNKQEHIRELFACGYCYYFAHMLKTAFNRGTVCWAAPYGHILWQDDDGKLYDIEGEYVPQEHDLFYAIPEEYLGVYINEFKHTPEAKRISAENRSTKEALINIVKRYCEDTGKEYRKEVESYFYDDEYYSNQPEFKAV